MKQVLRWQLLCSLEKMPLLTQEGEEQSDSDAANSHQKRCQLQLVSSCLWHRGECRRGLPQSGQSWAQRLLSSQAERRVILGWSGEERGILSTWVLMWAAICIPAARPQNRNASRIINLVRRSTLWWEQRNDVKKAIFSIISKITLLFSHQWWSCQRGGS